MSDKRQYLRIEAYVSIEYRVLAAGEYERAQKKCLEKHLCTESAALSSLIGELDPENLRNPPPISLEGMEPRTAKAFGEIDRKLNLILRLLVENTLSDIQGNKLCEVNLSGGGLRLTIPERLKAGDKLEMEIFLPGATPVAMLAIAEVVRADAIKDDKGDPAYETALKFTDIVEDDRERIIQYVFKHQRHALRNRAIQAKAE